MGVRVIRPMGFQVFLQYPAQLKTNTPDIEIAEMGYHFGIGVSRWDYCVELSFSLLPSEGLFASMRGPASGAFV